MTELILEYTVADRGDGDGIIIETAMSRRMRIFRQGGKWLVLIERAGKDAELLDGLPEFSPALKRALLAVLGALEGGRNIVIKKSSRRMVGNRAESVP